MAKGTSESSSGAATGDAKAAKRRGQTRLAGSLVAGLTKRAIGRHGFAQASIITDWATIIGPDLAKFAQPDKLTFPKGQRIHGTLHIRAAGPMALQIQHLAPLLIERVNAHFGYGAVADIKLHQAGLPVRAKQQKRPPARTPSTMERAALETTLSGLEDDVLKDRLRRLGEAVLSRNPATKGS